MRVQLTQTRRRAARGERGAAAIIVSILTVFLVGTLAFVSDFGLAYANKRVLRNGVDAAALAAAQEIAETAEPSYTCSAIEGALEGSSRVVAERYFADNGSALEGAISPGTAGYDIDCATGQLVVAVSAEQTSPNLFGPIFGAEHSNGIELGASAKVVVGSPDAVVGVRPLVICQVDAYELRDSSAEPRHIIYDNNAPDPPLGCGSGSGNFGLLNLDGGPNGTTELQQWFEEGFQGEFGAPATCVDADIQCTEGSPGFRNSVVSALPSILGENIVIPVFDTVSGSGSTITYHVQGFVSVQVCGWRLNGSEVTDVGYENACYDPSAEPTITARDNWFQLKYVNYVPGGDPSSACSLGNAECDYGARVFRLAE